MGQTRVIEVLKEHGELTIKEIDKLIDDMSLPAIRRSIVRLSNAGELEKRRVMTGTRSTPNKYRLKEGRGE